MGYRSNMEQSEHDLVIRACANTYPPGRLYTNPNGERNRSIKGLYPDVIFYRNGETIIEEIETSFTVNVEERKQWERYASLGCTFHLIVPWHIRNEALRLTKDLSINLLEWYHIENGQVQFGKV